MRAAGRQAGRQGYCSASHVHVFALLGESGGFGGGSSNGEAGGVLYMLKPYAGWAG